MGEDADPTDPTEEGHGELGTIASTSASASECLIATYEGWKSWKYVSYSDVSAIQTCQGYVNQTAQRHCEVFGNVELFSTPYHVYRHSTRIMSDNADWKCVDGVPSYY